jgi:hypothetical protein
MTEGKVLQMRTKTIKRKSCKQAQKRRMDCRCTCLVSKWVIATFKEKIHGVVDGTKDEEIMTLSKKNGSEWQE